MPAALLPPLPLHYRDIERPLYTHAISQPRIKSCMNNVILSSTALVGPNGFIQGIK